MKNNKLIAEFMGMKLGEDHTNDNMYYDDAENLHPPTPINELKFNSSWGWLMPVVESIFERLDSKDNSVNEIKKYLLVCCLDETYNAVVFWIKENNNNYKTI